MLRLCVYASVWCACVSLCIPFYFRCHQLGTDHCLHHMLFLLSLFVLFKAFPSTHAALCSFLGLSSKHLRASARRNVARSRQRKAFFLFVGLVSQRNFRRFPFFRRILSFSLFGRGVHRSSISLLGSVGLSTSLSDAYGSLVKYAIRTRTALRPLLSSLPHVYGCLDNSHFFRNEKTPRGGKSSQGFTGTIRYYRLASPYNNAALDFLHDRVGPPLTFLRQQFVSPVGMPPFERLPSLWHCIGFVRGWSDDEHSFCSESRYFDFSGGPLDLTILPGVIFAHDRSAGDGQSGDDSDGNDGASDGCSDAGGGGGGSVGAHRATHPAGDGGPAGTTRTTGASDHDGSDPAGGDDDDGGGDDFDPLDDPLRLLPLATDRLEYLRLHLEHCPDAALLGFVSSASAITGAPSSGLTLTESMPRSEVVSTVLSSCRSSPRLLDACLLCAWEDRPDVDFSGRRVERYEAACRLVDDISSIHRLASGTQLSDILPPDLRDNQHYLAARRLARYHRPVARDVLPLQHRTVRHYNPGIDALTPVIIPPMSGDNELTTKGAGDVVVRMALESGFLDGAGDYGGIPWDRPACDESEEAVRSVPPSLASSSSDERDPVLGPLRSAPHSTGRKLFLFGDCKTVQNVIGNARRLAEATSVHSCHDFGDAYHRLVAVDRFLSENVVILSGGWHRQLRVLWIVFKKFWGGLIQPIATCLRVKGLSQDPTESYQLSRFMVFLIGSELERLLLDRYCREFGEHLIPESIRSNLRAWCAHDLDKDADDDLRDESAPIYRRFVCGFREFMRRMNSNLDDASSALYQFWRLYRILKALVSSHRLGDSIRSEHISASLLPLFHGAGCKNYREVTLSDMLNRHGLTYSQLQELRTNECVSCTSACLVLVVLGCVGLCWALVGRFSLQLAASASPSPFVPLASRSPT